MEIPTVQLRQTSSESNLKVDISKCIICQQENKAKTTGAERGRKRILEAASIRKDCVNKRLKAIDGIDKFVYHSTNQCYKNYTLQKTLKTIIQKSAQSKSHLGTDKNSSRIRRSQISARSNPTKDINVYKTSCVICGHLKGFGTYKKYRLSENESAKRFLDATIYFKDEVYTRTCDLNNKESVFAADLYYHTKCLRKYIRNYEYICSKEDMSLGKTKDDIFEIFFDRIDTGLKSVEGFELSNIRTIANDCNSDISFSNREIKLGLCKHYGTNVHFSIPRQVNKSEMCFYKCNTEDLADSIRCFNPISECAKKLREELMATDFDLQNSFCDATALEKSWEQFQMPDVFIQFFAVLFGFNEKCFQTPDDCENCTEDICNDENPDNIKGNILTKAKN